MYVSAEVIRTKDMDTTSKYEKISVNKSFDVPIKIRTLNIKD